MHKVLPNGRFIYMVRDPVERLISRYMHDICECLHEDEPEVAFSGDPLSNRYISESLYFTQFRQFTRYFDREQFLIIDSERFRHHRKDTLRSVFRFLGVDDSFEHKAFEVVRHPTSGKRRKNSFGRALHKHLGGHVLKGLQQLPLPMPLQRAISHRGDQALYWLFSRPMERPRLDPEFRTSLNDIFRPEIEQFEEAVGQKFSSWLRSPG